MSADKPLEPVVESVLNRLRANATVQQRLAAFATNLRAQGYNVTTAIDVRRYDSGFCLETFVDVERPAPARSVCWWCEVVPVDGRWRIETYVIQTAQGGQDNLEDFAKIDVESSDGLDAAFEAAVGRLLQSER